MSATSEKFTNTSRFWVVFDTCQLPAYYKDVHNLLALPAGAIIRYDYHARFISEEALAAIQMTADAPRDVLLMYVQYEGYDRGAGTAYRPVAGERVYAFGTRFAKMRLTPHIGGQTYAFDLELQGYPKVDSGVIDSILAPLVRNDQAPWSKWVALSDLVNEFAMLNNGKDADNWAELVGYLGRAPLQFEGDVFWRLAPPVLVDEKVASMSIGYTDSQAEDGLRQVSFSYPLKEGRKCEIEIFSHVNYQPAANGARQLKVAVDPGGPLQYDGSANIELRYNAASRIVVRAQRAETVDERFGKLSLESGEDVNGWPIGPRLTLPFSVIKSKAGVVLSSICLLLALVFAGLAERIWKESLVYGISSGVIAGAFVLIGTLFLTRKIGVKL